jgi:hypothetical protein
MEMHARLPAQRHRREKAVHEEALAAPDPAPQIETTWHVGWIEKTLERRLPRRAKGGELVGQLLQPIERVGLRVIERRSALAQQRVEVVEERAFAARDLARGERPSHPTTPTLAAGAAALPRAAVRS